MVNCQILTLFVLFKKHKRTELTQGARSHHVGSVAMYPAFAANAGVLQLGIPLPHSPQSQTVCTNSCHLEHSVRHTPHPSDRVQTVKGRDEQDRGPSNFREAPITFFFP